jgi:hypothetical protein
LVVRRISYPALPGATRRWGLGRTFSLSTAAPRRADFDAGLGLVIRLKLIALSRKEKSNHENESRNFAATTTTTTTTATTIDDDMMTPRTMLQVARADDGKVCTCFSL